MTDGVSLRDHVEARFAELEKRLDERDLRYAQRFEAQQEALGEVKESYNADKKQANEWRGALDDTQSHHASRDALNSLADKVADLSEWRRGQEEWRRGSGYTRGQIAAGIALMGTVMGIIAGIIAFAA